MVSTTKKAPPPPLPSAAPDSLAARVIVPNAAAGSPIAVRRIAPGEVGFKVCVYGPPKAGKSTLASLAPNPVFIDLNAGLSGLNIAVVDQPVPTFDVLRKLVQQFASYVPVNGTLVIDSMTEVDTMILDHLTVKYDKKSVKELGFDRFPCSVEAFRLLLSDLDAVVRSKRNVLLLAHEVSSNFKNALGDDYRILGPAMSHAATGSCQGQLVAWCDHVVRIALSEPTVKVELNAMGKIASRKVVGASSARIITADGTQSVPATYSSATNCFTTCSMISALRGSSV